MRFRPLLPILTAISQSTTRSFTQPAHCNHVPLTHVHTPAPPFTVYTPSNHAPPQTQHHNPHATQICFLQSHVHPYTIAHPLLPVTLFYPWPLPRRGWRFAPEVGNGDILIPTQNLLTCCQTFSRIGKTADSQPTILPKPAFFVRFRPLLLIFSMQVVNQPRSFAQYPPRYLYPWPLPRRIYLVLFPWFSI